MLNCKSCSVTERGKMKENELGPGINDWLKHKGVFGS